MEDLLISLQNRIKETLPELRYIDEDFGQLETLDDTYPITFPCVLIGTPSTDWSDIGLCIQKGAANISIRLAIDCYDDTHYGSGTEDKIKERLLKNKTLYKSLQGFRTGKYMSALSRIKSTDYTFAHGIKVYEMIFKFSFHDDSAAIRKTV